MKLPSKFNTEPPKSPYSKEERRAIYEQAIKDFERDVGEDEKWKYRTDQGFCRYFSVHHNIYIQDMDDFMLKLPEIAQQRPPGSYFCAWWPLEDKVIRIKTLKQALVIL